MCDIGVLPHTCVNKASFFFFSFEQWRGRSGKSGGSKSNLIGWQRKRFRAQSREHRLNVHWMKYETANQTCLPASTSRCPPLHHETQLAQSTLIFLQRQCKILLIVSLMPLQGTYGIVGCFISFSSHSNWCDGILLLSHWSPWRKVI